MLFLKSEANSAEDIAKTLSEACAYLDIAVVGLIPFAIVQHMREHSEKPAKPWLP